MFCKKQRLYSKKIVGEYGEKSRKEEKHRIYTIHAYTYIFNIRSAIKNREKMLIASFLLFLSQKHTAITTTTTKRTTTKINKKELYLLKAKYSEEEMNAMRCMLMMMTTVVIVMGFNQTNIKFCKFFIWCNQCPYYHFILITYSLQQNVFSRVRCSLQLDRFTTRLNWLLFLSFLMKNDVHCKNI